MDERLFLKEEENCNSSFLRRELTTKKVGVVIFSEFLNSEIVSDTRRLVLDIIEECGENKYPLFVQISDSFGLSQVGIMKVPKNRIDLLKSIN